jgi:hypothetical protein
LQLFLYRQLFGDEVQAHASEGFEPFVHSGLFTSLGGLAFSTVIKMAR